MKNLIIKIIHLYQKTPLASHMHCRFTPTCSNYMIEALNEYGVCSGLYLGIKRIFRCNPLSKKYGYDPVIKRGEKIK